MLAPHPFCEDRGTPIAVNLLLRVLADRGERVDLLTYHIGRDVRHPNLVIHRIPAIPGIRHVRPGFSFQKLVCDFFLAIKAVRLAAKNRYDFVHAVEESVFIALLIRLLFKIPYVYDMDSSLADQLAERYPFLAPVRGLMRGFEHQAVKRAMAVVPMCDALGGLAESYDASRIVVLRDVSILSPPIESERLNLRQEFGHEATILMYVGNLEGYQGIDLLIDGFAVAVRRCPKARLVLIGGDQGGIRRYQDKCGSLGLGAVVRFLGPKPAEHLAVYLAESDILVSPRVKGSNTPMKLYSYLHSGKPILATRLETHTQVIDDDVAVLAEPSVGPFAEAMARLIGDKDLQRRFGEAGRRLAEERYSLKSFSDTANGLFEELRDQLKTENRKPVATSRGTNA